jgi:hypothetical protein
MSDGGLRDRLGKAGVSIGKDDAVVLWHSTSPCGARSIIDSGAIEAKESDAIDGPAAVYLSTSPEIVAVHGGDVVLPIRIRVLDLAGETLWPAEPDQPVERIDFSVTKSPFLPLGIARDAFVDRAAETGPDWLLEDE